MNMPAPSRLSDLVTRFREQLDDYKRGAYNETQLRRDFLDPLFKLLGWDVNNSAGYAESFREVVHEDSIRVGGQLAAARTAHDKTLIQRQIDATDKQIDAQVYEVYGLTEDEIRIVEGTDA